MAPAHAPSLEIRGLTKRFRRVVALDSLDLTLSPGEVFALLGSNGSGKSTTFRLLLNIYHPSSGEAIVLGTSSRKLDGRALEKVGYISEGQKLPAWMTVSRFLDYCAGFYSGWDAELCRSLVERFELPPLQKIKHLSRGQRMKICLAGTLPAHPALLMLDEPFSGLDVETRASLSSLLRNLALDTGLAILITTHDVEEIEPVATRLGVLRLGKLIVDEPLQSFLARHQFIHVDAGCFSTLPPDLSGSLMKTLSPNGCERFYTDSYTSDLEIRLRHHLGEDSSPTFTPMSLREILSAPSLRRS